MIVSSNYGNFASHNVSAYGVHESQGGRADVDHSSLQGTRAGATYQPVRTTMHSSPLSLGRRFCSRTGAWQLRLCCRARRRLPVLDVKSLEQRPPAKSRVLTHHSHNHPKQIPSRSNRLRVGLARRQRSQTTCATSSAAPSQVLNGASSWPQTKN